MSSFTQSEHEELLGAVAERYRNDGYEVILEPGADVIPFDLGDYHPDLLARKGGVAAIVEVKSQTRNLSFDQLKSLADEIRRHRGWRFVLITGQDVVEPGSLREEEDTFSWDKIARRLVLSCENWRYGFSTTAC
jgi:Holliday junction resolvase